MMKVGFIGAGNMGYALMSGMKGACELLVYDISEKMMARAEDTLGAVCMDNVQQLVKESDLIFAAVKPQFLAPVVEEMKETFSMEKVICSIVAGRSTGFWKEHFGSEAKVARIMPNTPAMVKEAMNTVCYSESVTAQEKQLVEELLKMTGKVMPIREEVMEAAMGVAGCGPAFVYMMIEAMADAGVAEGLFRDQAITLAAQTLLGAAKMVLETGKHPEQLKDEVCSPGGTTIRGVMALEKGGFRAAIEDAIEAAAHKKV